MLNYYANVNKVVVKIFFTRFLRGTALALNSGFIIVDIFFRRYLCT